MVFVVTFNAEKVGCYELVAFRAVILQRPGGVSRGSITKVQARIYDFLIKGAYGRI